MVYGVYVAAPYGDVIHNWPYAARKRTGDAENGWRPPPDKNIEPVPHWGKKNSLESCLVYLGRWDVKRNGHAKTSALLIHERNELRGCALLKACRVPAVFRYN